MCDNKNGFEYTYSAKEQAELKKIREKYAPVTDATDKMTRLRKLDASVTNLAQIIALTIGVISTLTLGFGMSLFMSDLGNALGLNADVSMLIGICAGVIGGIIASLAYPIYNLIANARRKKLAPEILRLVDELTK
jgi:hypothetical protein